MASVENSVTTSLEKLGGNVENFAEKNKKILFVIGILGISIIIYLLVKNLKVFRFKRPHYPITSGFNAASRNYNHNGTDFGGKYGDDVLAIERGKVITAHTGCIEGDTNCGGQNGNFVLIDHQNGYKSIYLHLSQTLVQPGDTVKRGQLIGKMGNTGNSRGTHLHLSITDKNGQYINPESILS
jgi:murein DD-endopeptidase MepM/ murein hydrolase activator NlpD